MADAQDEYERLVAEIEQVQNRTALVCDAFKSHQDSVFSLARQGANSVLIEEHRDKAAIYYETFLDLSLQTIKLTRQLTQPKKK